MRQSACDLTVCDGKMPELNGLDVYRQPRDMDPQAARRMMFMTGDMVNETFKSFL
jgi:CheY-like chemotaxis protein